MVSLEDKQKEICVKYQAPFQECDLNLKVGIAASVKEGIRPIYGVRVKEESGTSGWYIWAGEWSNDPDFFLPLHGTHINDWADIILPYLELPEGWKFIISEDYEDVWYEPSQPR